MNIMQHELTCSMGVIRYKTIRTSSQTISNECLNSNQLKPPRKKHEVRKFLAQNPSQDAQQPPDAAKGICHQKKERNSFRRVHRGRRGCILATVSDTLNCITHGSVALAPMDDITDHPFRLICREMGSEFSYSEFVSADAICRKVDRSLKKIRFTETERPILIQIFGGDVETLVEAAKIVEEYKPDGIDINMGCSVKKIFQKGGGIGLMQNPDKVKTLFRRLTCEIKTPVSAKIRLGISDSEKNYLEIGKILEGEGAWAVFIHARTKAMGYSGKASWDDIGKLREHLKIPVFGNGDIQSLAEAHEKIRTYNLNGVLIGRAAIGDPWIFSGRNLYDIPFTERLLVINRHLDLNIELYGDDYGVILFRKQLVKYLKGLPGSAHLKPVLLHETSGEKIIQILEDYARRSAL